MKIVFQNKSSLYAGPWGFLAQVIVMTLSVLLASRIIPSVQMQSVGVAVLTAVVIALLNNFIRPILIVLTLPFMIFSMGLFLFIVNTIIILFADALVPGFSVGGFGNALLFSILLTVLNYLLEIPNRMMRKPHYSERQDTDNEEYAEYEDVTHSDEKH